MRLKEQFEFALFRPRLERRNHGDLRNNRTTNSNTEAHSELKLNGLNPSTSW